MIAEQSFGEESNLFGQVAQDDRFAYTVRVGIHPANTFVRISWSGGRPEEVRAFRTLTDAFAKPSANSSLYVESQGGEETGVRRLHRRPVPPRARARASRSAACSAR